MLYILPQESELKYHGVTKGSTNTVYVRMVHVYCQGQRDAETVVNYTNPKANKNRPPTYCTK